MRGRSGVWVNTKIWCIRNDLGRETKFGTTSLRNGLGLLGSNLVRDTRPSVPGGLRGLMFSFSFGTGLIEN
jgi:hypothetical protein